MDASGAIVFSQATLGTALHEMCHGLSRRLGDDPVTLNTRLGRRLAVKLEWLAGQNGTSKRDAVEQAVEAWVRAEMRRHGVRDGDT